MLSYALTILALFMVLVLIINLSACAFTLLLSLFQFRRLESSFPDATEEPPYENTPFVSVHVAVHDEPADLVIATLDALAALNYDHFEVVLIDNNSPDTATWHPVRDHMAQLGPHFRFFERQNVRGAKAGALNIARFEMNSAATFIAVIDADYQVVPDFLNIAVSSCADADFVQFPQAYRNSAKADLVARELSDYFALYPKSANRFGTALPTGTLSMIRVNWLDKVGGWPTASITEDAEIGVALWLAGANGLFVDKVVGRGLLPINLDGLRIQRERWVAGNAQTLLGWLRSVQSPPTGALSVLTQLTAWPAFLAVPLMALTLILACRLFLPTPLTVSFQVAEVISIITIFATIMALLVRALVTSRLDTLAVKFALVWTSSFSWLPVLWGQTLGFRRTPKTVGSPQSALSVDTIGSLIAGSLAVGFLWVGHPITAAIIGLTSIGMATAPFVDRSLRRCSLTLGL